MSDLKSLVKYICKNYPYKHELSKARLTKMVYLADWRRALRTGHQLTEIKWRYNHYGPYVSDVIDQTRNDPNFKIEETVNQYGNVKELVTYIGPDDVKIEKSDAEDLDFVIEKTRTLTWDGFIKLVYSTYPVVVSDRHDDLDIEALAARYAAEKERLGLDEVA